MIGDVPYGTAQLEASFPAHGSLPINGDPKVRHRRPRRRHQETAAEPAATNAYFAQIFAGFSTLTPLVYTPGDNEWTDCHRANNGAYDPLERLGVVRDGVLPRPGVWRWRAASSKS